MQHHSGRHKDAVFPHARRHLHVMPFTIMLRFVTVCTISYLLLGRVALGARRPIVIKLSRGRPVGLCVGLSSALWKNGGSDLDAVGHRRSHASRAVAGSDVWGSVHGKGYIWGEFGGSIVTNGDFTAYV